MKKILFISFFTLQLFSFQGISQVSPFLALYAPDTSGVPDCQNVDTNLFFTLFSHSGIIDAVTNNPPLFLMDYNTQTFALPAWYSDDGVSYYFWSGSAWNPCVQYCGLPPITISGDSVVYAYSTINYSVIDTMGSTYSWMLNNGNVVSGQGTASVQIQWGAQGNDLITLIETRIGGCIDTLMLSVTVLGNTSVINNSKANLTAYPNPTNDLITLEIEGYNGSINVEIYDLQGRLLETSNKTTISLKKYSKGIYVFRVSYGDKTEEVRVLRD